MSESIERKSVVSGLFWKFSEILCTDGVSFIVSIVLARILMPEEYGQIALVNVFVTLANVFVVNGLGTALIQKKNADNLDFSSVLYFNFLFSVLLYLLLYGAAPYIANFYGEKQLIPVLRVLGLRIPIASINSIQNAYVSRNMLFKKLFVVNLLSTLISGVVGILMAYFGMGVWALVGQILVSAIAGTIVTAIVTKWVPILCFSWNRLKSLIDYGWKILASSLIKVGYEQLSDLIIGKLYTSKDLAFYSRGKKYPALVVDSINSSISAVLFPAISKQQDSPEKVKAMVRRSIRTSTYVLTPLLFGMAALAEPMIRFMLTEKWLSCVPYLRIACIYYALQPVQTANLQAIRAVGRSDIILKLDIIKRGLGVILLLSLMRKGPIGVALAPVGMSLVAMMINIRPNIKLIGYSYKEQFLDLLPNLSLSLTMALIVYGFNCLVNDVCGSDVLVIILGIFIGVIYYILVSLCSKNDSFLYMVNMMKSYLPKRKK